MIPNSEPRSLQANLPSKLDQSTVMAQLEFFIRLGNMSDIDPNRDFAAILNLGNSLIEGDLPAIQKALAFYTNNSKLLFEHLEFLRRAFAHAGVSFQEPAVLKYEASIGQIKTVVVMAILLERAGKIAFISSDPALASYVHSFTRSKAGIMTLVPKKEDPGLLLKQISRVIRIPDVIGPPPHATAIV